MIIYDNTDWLVTAFYPNFNFIIRVAPRVSLVALWSLARIHWFESVVISNRGCAVLGGCVTFLTVMRANQGYNRYQLGCATVSQLEHVIRGLMRITVNYCKGFGGESGLDATTISDMEELWTNTTRLCLAFLLCVNIKARLGYARAVSGYNELVLDGDAYQQLRYDRARLRGLLYEKEFNYVDPLLGRIVHSSGAYSCFDRITMQYNEMQSVHYHKSENDGRDRRPAVNPCDPVVAISLLLGWEMYRHLAGRFYERVLNYIDNRIDRMMLHYQQIEENMTMHFPICFAQMNKLLLLFFLGCFPFVLEPDVSMWSSVFFPTVAAFMYFGIEYVGIEIEVPFGDGDMDINLLRLLRFFESESVTMLMLAEERAQEICKGGEGPKPLRHFMWVQIPEEYQTSSVHVGHAQSRSRWYLQLKSEMAAAHELQTVRWGEDSNGASSRVVSRALLSCPETCSRQSSSPLNAHEAVG